MHELQYALRRLRGSPGFTIAATLTMAIAIGATASVFGVVDGVLLKAFPYRDPDRVSTIWEGNAQLHVPKFTVSPADFLDFGAQNRAYTALAASENSYAIVTGSHESEHLTALAVTPSYFPVLGITPVLGRPLSPDSGGTPEVVIGYGYWQRHFGGCAEPVPIGEGRSRGRVVGPEILRRP
jgi:putative ABC transport system permease protein